MLYFLDLKTNTHPYKAFKIAVSNILLTALVFSALPSQAVYAKELKEPNLIVNTEAFQMIDTGNGSDPIALRFGASTNFIQYINGIFHFSAGISVLGTISGTSLTVDRNASISGALLVKGTIATKATLSGGALTVMGGNSYILGNVGIGKSGTPNTKLEVLGTVSGSAVVTNRASIGTTASGHLLTVGRVGSGTRIATMTNATLFSVDQMALGQLEGGAYFGRVGLKENQWGLSNYGRTWSSRALSAYWTGSATSSDGKIQTIVNNYSGLDTGKIFTSYDYGTTWTAQGSSGIAWNNIAMSSDGKIQVATVSLGSIYISSDYGITWASVPNTSYAWSGIAMSSDGKIIAASTSDDYVFISKNYGKSWTASTGINSLNDIAMSSDGKIMTAVRFSGKIYVSTDYGSTWRSKDSTRNWRKITMSDDGKFQTATVSGGTIYRSMDYGNTWSSTESSRNWEDVEMSSNGALQVAIVNGGYVYVSTDYGNTWAQTGSSGNWNSVAISSDGKVFTAVQNGGYAYVSYADSTLQGNINVSATISGTTLNASTLLTGSTLQGFGLYNCQGTSNKLTYNSTTKKFLCETDQAGGASSPEVGTASFSGATLRLADPRYVNTSGDTMTGALTINVTGGNDATVALKVLNSITGSMIHAEKSLTSSGILTVKGNASVKGTLSGANLTFMGVTSSYILGNLGVGTTAPETKLEVLGTISGTTLNASTLLTGSTLQGFGLYNCQGTSNKLTYNSTTKKFLCESDQAGSSYTAGQGLSLNGSSFSVNATLTGSLAKFSTLSGYVVHAKNALSSSGTLRVVGAGIFDGSLTFGDALADAITVNAGTWTFANDTNFVLSGGVNGLSFDTSTLSIDAMNDRVGIGTTSPDTALEVIGTISGTTLNASTLLTGSTLQGFGLYNCQGTSNKLTYNSTTKKFQCEVDAQGVGTSSFSGAILRMSDPRYVRKAGDTMTGALTIDLNGTSGTGLILRERAYLGSGATLSGTLLLKTITNNQLLAAPGYMKTYAADNAGRSMLHARTSTGAEYAYQPALFSTQVMQLTTGGGTTINGIGTTVTSDTTVSHSSDETFGYMANFATAATSNDTAGTSSINTTFFRGSAVGANGFFFSARIGVVDTTSIRTFVGLGNQTIATMVGADAPTGHHIGFQYSTNRSDTNWQFEMRDGTTQNVVNTGVAFTANKVYDLSFYCVNQCNSVSWQIKNVTDGTITKGSTSSNLPGASTSLRMVVGVSTLTTSAKNIRMQQAYCEANR